MEAAAVALIGTGAVVIGVLVLVYLTPDKVAVWSSWVYRAVAWVFRRVDRKAVALHLEGRFNQMSTELAKKSFSDRAQGVRVEWVGRHESPSQFLEANRVVVRLQSHRSRDRNFVHGGMMIIASTFAVRGKRLLSKLQRSAIDLHAARAMFDGSSASVANLFYEDVFGPALDRDAKLAELAETLDRLDKAGLFFPVATQELVWLGRRFYVAPRDGSLVLEAQAFLEFLARYAERPVGDETVPLLYVGRYFRCGIVIVARTARREQGDITPWVRHVRRLADQGAEAAYLIGSAQTENATFMDQIGEALCQTPDRGWVRQFKVSYSARLIGPDGSPSVVSTYLVSLRLRMAERYVHLAKPVADAPVTLAATED